MSSMAATGIPERERAQLDLPRLASPRRSSLSLQMLMGVLGAAALLSAVLLAMTTAALSEPETLARAAERPLGAIRAIVGLVVLAALVLLPFQRLAERLSGPSLVGIDTEGVTIEALGLLGRTTRVLPLSSFLGIAPRLTTTLSGLRHQIVLVHRDGARDVVLADDIRADPAHIAAIAHRLQLPEITHQDIRRLRATIGSPGADAGMTTAVGAQA